MLLIIDYVKNCKYQFVFFALCPLGGSLIVQIFGSSSTKLPKGGKDSRQRERLLVSDKLGCLSSPIV